MSSILNFSKANPVRFVRTFFNGINNRDPENRLFRDWSHKHKTVWFQKFQQNDTIRFQFQSSFDLNAIRLVDYQSKKVLIDDSPVDFVEFEDGTTAQFEDGTEMLFEGSEDSKTEVIASETGFTPYEGEYVLSNIPPGIYQFIGEGSMITGSGTYRVESELFEVREEWKNSRLIKYYNNEPAFGIDYRSNKVNQVRILGSFIKPEHDNEIETQISILSSVSKLRDYTLERRVLEFYEIVPSWFVEKINLVLSHDFVSIDDVEIVAAEKMNYSFNGYADGMTKPSVTLNIKQNDFINRHDSGSRQTY